MRVHLLLCGLVLAECGIDDDHLLMLQAHVQEPDTEKLSVDVAGHDAKDVTDDAAGCVHCNSYQSATPLVKQQRIWEKVKETKFTNFEKSDFIDSCESLKLMKKIEMNVMFDRFSDERPPKMPRFFHTAGSIAQVKFLAVDGHKFTGLFKGAANGVARVSPCAPMVKDGLVVKHILGTYPFSMAFKFFRDGIHSGNMVACDSNIGMRKFSAGRTMMSPGNYNFFTRPISTVTDLPEELDYKFGGNEVTVGALSTADFASYDETGAAETSVVFPHIAWFTPNKDLAKKFGKGEIDFRKYFDSPGVEEGTKLYDVTTTVDANGDPAWCFCEIEGEPCGEEEDIEKARQNGNCTGIVVQKIGEIVTDSKFLASRWVDSSLFFQHTRSCPKAQKMCTVTKKGTGKFSSAASGGADKCFSTNDLDAVTTAPDCPLETTGTPAEFCSIDDTVLNAQAAKCPLMNSLKASIKGKELTGNTYIQDGCAAGLPGELLNTVLEVVLDLLKAVMSIFPER